MAGLLSLAGVLAARHFIGPRGGVDFIVGVAFGAANIVVMGGLVRVTLRTGGALPKKAAIWAAVKFPVLYGALFAVLHWGHVNALAFLAGFTAMLGALLIAGLLPASHRRPTAPSNTDGSPTTAGAARTTNDTPSHS